MFTDVSDLLQVFEVFGINIMLVAMTAGFVSVIKKIFVTAKLNVPSWIWLVVVLLAGFVIALFEVQTIGEWIAAGIKNSTAASYAYNVWDKVQKKFQTKDEDHDV